MIEIDGSEGGGQILRTALSLSIITSKPFIIKNIRKSRPKPGLQPQHLEAVKAAQKISEAKIEGDFLNSCELKFHPFQIKSGNYQFKIKTAGSISLLLHSIYLPLCLAKESSSVIIEGGTHVPRSPTFNYLEDCWLWFLQKIGISLSLELKRAGFYPHGGGIVKAIVNPSTKINSLIIINRGKLNKFKIYSAHSNLKDEVALRQAKTAETILSKKSPSIPIQTFTSSLPSLSRNTTISITAYFDNTVACYTELGEKGKPAEEVAESACRKLLTFLNSKATTDEYIADQLLLPLALALNNEPSELIPPQITNHIRTNIYTIQKFLNVRFEINEGIIKILPQN